MSDNEIMDTSSEIKIVTVSITKKGKESLLELLQEHIGYIEEEIHEQILNDIQTWMNENYKYLIEFYVQAVEKKLIPIQQLDELIKINKQLRKQLIKLSVKKDEVIKKDIIEVEVIKKDIIENDDFKQIDKMNGWDLRRLAKKMKINIPKGTNKDKIYELVKQKIQKT